jgi:hypothetical protein
VRDRLEDIVDVEIGGEIALLVDILTSTFILITIAANT